MMKRSLGSIIKRELERQGIFKAKYETKKQKYMRRFNWYAAPLIGLALFIQQGCPSRIYEMVSPDSDPTDSRKAPGNGSGDKSSPDDQIHSGDGTGSGGYHYSTDPLDPKHHLDEARKITYENQTPQGKTPSQNKPTNKQADPTIENTLTNDYDRLKFERETSYIIPRPVAGIDDKVRDAVVFLDVSGSMDRHVTYDPSMRQTTNIPAVAALAISDYYISKVKGSVAGATFASGTDYTNYTKNMELLAKLFARMPSGGTELDGKILMKIASDPKRPNADKPLDIYLISDMAIDDLDSLVKEISGISNLGRIYVLEVGSKYNTGIVTKLFGKSAYRAPLSDEQDLKSFYRKFKSDNEQTPGSPKGNSLQNSVNQPLIQNSMSMIDSGNKTTNHYSANARKMRQFPGYRR